MIVLLHEAYGESCMKDHTICHRYADFKNGWKLEKLISRGGGPVTVRKEVIINTV